MLLVKKMKKLYNYCVMLGQNKMEKIINYRMLFLLLVILAGNLCAMDVDDIGSERKNPRTEEGVELYAPSENVQTLLPREIQRFIFTFLKSGESFDSVVSTIRSTLLTSKLWFNMFQQDVFLVDYLIAQLVYRYKVRLNDVIYALGRNIVGNWVAIFRVLQEEIQEDVLKIDVDILPFASYYLFPEVNKLALMRTLLSTKNILFTTNMVDAFGRTPLIYAAMHGDVDLTDRFIQRGADLDHRDQNSASAWFYAKLFHYVDVTMLLENAEQARKNSNFADKIARWNEFLKNFAWLVFRNDQETLDNFVVNAQQYDINLVELIRNMDNFAKELLIRDAAINGSLYTLLLAERVGLEINSVFNMGEVSFLTTLMCAVFSDDVNTVLFLLSRGADINATEMDGFTALKYAIERKKHAIIADLVRLGADVNHRSNAEITPLMVASRERDISIVQFLVENGANINDINDQGFSAVTYAILSENTLVMKYLVEQGGIADLTILNLDQLNDQQKRLVATYELEMEYKSF